MSRTPLFNEVARALRIARFCEDHQLSTGDGLGLVRETEIKRGRVCVRAGANGCAPLRGRAPPVQPPLFYRQPSGCSRGSLVRGPDVGIVGAGLAGLACADALADNGVRATVYEAGSRLGGRCLSLRGFFPGQVAERGGEFIDTPHKTMLRYARRFGLALEDVSKEPGDVFYHLGGQLVPEAAVVDEFRDFVQVMRLDLRRLSNETTALSHTDADVALDGTSLAAYLEGANGAHRAAGPIAKAAIVAAYIAEFGLEADEQSSLNFLHFIHADRRSKFTPFGISSDERYHVLDGNDRIVSGLAGALPRPVELGMMLSAVRETAAGRVELTFEHAGRRRVAHARRCRPRDSVHDNARRRSRHRPGSGPREARSDRQPRVRDKRQDDGRLRTAAMDRSGRQRDGVRRSRKAHLHRGRRIPRARHPLAAC